MITGGQWNKKHLAIERLKAIDISDIEVAHCEADKILCELLEAFDCEDVVEAWKAVPKWYA